ncbi:MAG: adenylate/guanylate cyclase domain-containing protein [Deferribacteres bacterium]|nr:adenylate/guanylate cyclase domain-containing protein [candidate division KSB1 bacterium]MCB9501841.1 adenylate/guanylate cyclase domain-containing protein [Deferribacteres bacterium]
MKIPTPRIIQFLINGFKSLEIQLKLSIIFVAVVVTAVVAFSIPILMQQEAVLKEKVQESSRFIAIKLSQDVKNILLYEVTGVDDPGGSVEEQLELLTRTNVAGLEYAFTLTTNGDIIVKPDSFRSNLKFDTTRVQELMLLEDFTAQRNNDYIEYYNPVQVKKGGLPITIGVVGIVFSEATILEPIATTEKLIFYTAIIIIFIAVTGIFFLSQLMVTQITDIFEAVRQVREGNLDFELKPRSEDELGHLATEFNRMVKHLREKLQMQKFVSSLTVQMIQERSGSRMKLTEGERHSISIFFSDVRNFTMIAERLEPEQIVKLINVYFQLQTEIIQKYSGVVDKFMGDQIMAIFPTGMMLQSAIEAAVEIQKSIFDLNNKRAANDEVTLDIGIGINHGSAVLGNMGSKDRMDYTVIGDIVNVASRLCSIARAGQIIVEATPLKAISKYYKTTRLEPILVKGRKTPVEICQIEYQ